MSESRIKKFLQLSREGQNFVCIICKRCTYPRSVQLLKPKKYNFDVTHLTHLVLTFKEVTYICKTCHLNLKKLSFKSFSSYKNASFLLQS